MAWYRSSKLGFNALSRYFTSKIAKTPIKNEIINQQLCKFLPNKDYFARVRRPVIANKSLGFRFLESYRCDHNRNIVRRYYNSQGSSKQRWFDRYKSVFRVWIVRVTSKFGYVETIPYTNRKHLILLSHEGEKRKGESYFKNIKDNTYKGKVLPANHPHSVRATAIFKNIVGALQRDLKKRNVGVVDMSAIDHLLGLKWEVMVVNDRKINAACAPGGKIVVFRGLLMYLTTDEEIATIIAHEVAHAVARHGAEQRTKLLWILITQLILFQYVNIIYAIAISNLLLQLPFRRRMESEADYIGLMLMASAGYDPRFAPQVYEKLSEAGRNIPSFLHYLTTHPSGQNRSKALSKSKVMQEALSSYRETKKRMKG